VGAVIEFLIHKNNIGSSAEAQTIVAVSPISSGTVVYQAVQVVLGLNTITSPAKVEYRAGNSIFLNPGFMADAGAVFTAKIQNPCNSIPGFQTNTNVNLPKEIKK
jgi:hypothetical protein